LVRNNRNVIISECHVYDNRDVGIFLDDVNLHQIIINTNHISYNAGGGIKVVGGNVRNLQICGNDIEYNFDRANREALAADVWFVAGNGAIREGTIVGNTIQALKSKGGANVRIEGFREGGNRKAGLLNITGNLITNQEYNVLILDSRGIAIQGNTFIPGPKRNIRAVNSFHVAIGPNVVDHNSDYGAETEGGIELEGCTGCTLSGLVLDHVRGADESSGAIDLRNSRTVNITGCNVIEPVHCGIVLRGARDCRVSDCIITGGRCAIREDVASENNMICNNRICGGGLLCEGKGTVQSGNLLT
jgi:hypothetical protein